MKKIKLDIKNPIHKSIISFFNGAKGCEDAIKILSGEARASSELAWELVRKEFSILKKIKNMKYKYYEKEIEILMDDNNEIESKKIKNKNSYRPIW